MIFIKNRILSILLFIPIFLGANFIVQGDIAYAQSNIIHTEIIEENRIAYIRVDAQAPSDIGIVERAIIQRFLVQIQNFENLIVDIRNVENPFLSEFAARIFLDSAIDSIYNITRFTFSDNYNVFSAFSQSSDIASLDYIAANFDIDTSSDYFQNIEQGSIFEYRRRPFSNQNQFEGKIWFVLDYDTSPNNNYFAWLAYNLNIGTLVGGQLASSDRFESIVSFSGYNLILISYGLNFPDNIQNHILSDTPLEYILNNIRN